MAMSAAERKRKQRAEEAAKKKGQQDPTDPYQKRPFFEFLKDNDSAWSNVQSSIHVAGFDPPVFEDDAGPVAPLDAGDLDFRGRTGSVGRAEVMIENLLTALVELSILVNRYKLEAVEARLAELAEDQLDTEDQRRAALEEAMMLATIKARLKKGVRWTFPEWSARGQTSER